MNLLHNALQNIRFNIPEAILTEAFLGPKYRQRGLTYSLDTMIRSEVYEKKVRVDMNMVSGMEVLIPLRGIPYNIVDNVNVVMRIPNDLTQGRAITTALSISLADNYAPAIAIGASSAVPISPYLQAVDQVVNSVLPIPLVASAHVRLIDENTIMINEAPTTISMCYLRAIVEHDAELTSIQPSSYPVLSELLLLATKAIVYNELAIKMGKGYLTGGMELGVFKDIVDEYRECAALYNELLINKWIKTSMLNDSTAKYRHLQQVSMLL
jgi:hypothetical protein